MKKSIIHLVAALCSMAAAGAIAAGNPAAASQRANAPPMTRAAYEAAQKRIAAQHKADDKHCKALEGEAEDLCQAQAQGKRDSARAELEARYQPSPEAWKKAKTAIAKANYMVAKERCDDLKSAAEARCLKEARAAREAAVRQARVEKVDATGGIFGKGEAADARASKVPGS